MVLVIEAGRPGHRYWRDVWSYRELLYFLAWRDILVRYKQTVIGISWALLKPALTMLVFVAFRRLAGMERSTIPEPLLVLAAVLPWQLFSTALNDSSASLVSNSNLVSRIYFPRIIVPCASIVTSLVDFAITLCMMGAVMVWYGFLPGWQFVALPLFILMTCIAAMGLGLLFAALSVRYRDFRYVVPFVVQFGIFFSPIAFTTADVPLQWQWLYALNPLVGIIEGFRWALLGGVTPLYPAHLASATLVALALLAGGVWYFRRTESGFADYI